MTTRERQYLAKFQRRYLRPPVTPRHWLRWWLSPSYRRRIRQQAARITEAVEEWHLAKWDLERAMEDDR